MELKQFLLNLKLRIKLLLAFGSILLLSLILVLKTFQTIQKSDHYQKMSEAIDALNLNLLEMDASINYFIAEGFKDTDFQQKNQSAYLDDYKTYLNEVMLQLELIGKSQVIEKDIALTGIRKSIDHITYQVYMLRGYLKQRGFKDFGLEGELRKAIHQVENSHYPFEKADMLTLRRHEKDFFLRKDLKYRDEFNTKSDLFIGAIEASLPTPERKEILAYLKSYHTKFNMVVAIEEKIGLQQGGLKEVIHKDFREAKQISSKLREHIKQDEREFRQHARTILLTLFIVQLTTGTAMAIVYSDLITRPIKQLKQAIGQFAEGSLPKKLPVNSQEEIGKTKLAFNQLIDRIKTAQDFAQALGKGRLDTDYAATYREDVLARSLTHMQTQLINAQRSQEIINWNNSGAAKLNEILKADDEAIEILGDRIIKMLVTYLKANQGALFLANHDGYQLCAERISSYAYEKKKFIDQRIEVGQGIIGQCLLEKSTIILKEVPSDYARITSGLGDAVPKFVIVVPLVIKKEIMGIIEIASFETLKNYEIEFLERICKNIASIVGSKKSAEDTRRLLNDARERAEQLISQEEEIRQNAEEMQAITEQLEREKKSMIDEIAKLRSLLRKDLVEGMMYETRT